MALYASWKEYERYTRDSNDVPYGGEDVWYRGEIVGYVTCYESQVNAVLLVGDGLVSKSIYELTYVNGNRNKPRQ